MPIRLLAIDLDGTLLTKERVPHPQNILAIQRAQKAGIRVVLASGRIASSVKQFSCELGLNGMMICSNGSHVVGTGDAELLYIGLDPGATKIALDYAERVGVHASGYTRNDLFFMSNSEWGETYRKRVRSATPIPASFDEAREMS